MGTRSGRLPRRQGVEPDCEGAHRLGIGLTWILGHHRPALSGTHEVPHRARGFLASAHVRRLTRIRHEMVAETVARDAVLLDLVAHRGPEGRVSADE